LREYPNLGSGCGVLASSVAAIFFASVADPRWQEKFCARIAQERRLPTRSTHSIPVFDLEGAFAAEFHSPWDRCNSKLSSGFPHIQLCDVEFLVKNCISSNTIFLTSAPFPSRTMLPEARKS
jgi:hypothetical protein